MDPPPTGSPGGGGGSGGTSGLDQDAQGTVDATPSFEAGECPGPVTGDLPCEIAAVLAICQSCHRNPPIRGAPFSFMSYEDTQAVYFGSERRWQRMAKVIEPTAPLHMPPRTETDIPQLTDAQLNTFISTKVSRLWRRPVSGTSPEGMALKTLYNSGTAAEDGGPANAFSVLLQAVLQAPSFLFRTELGNNPTPAAASFQLTPYELASALSMMFLESAPDDAMWAKAADGTLSDPTVLNTEVDRLMGQQVAKDNMALKLGYWLWTERVPARDKDPALFDTYTTAVRQSVYQSGQAFVKDLLANGTLADLFTSNKMWVNKDITTVYGIPGGAGATMTPTTTTLPERSSGLLTQPAFIAGVHKREAITDPIHMGLFIYEELLCDGDAGGPIPAPPADAFEKAAKMMGTEREIAAQRAMNTCVACHGRFDPFGLTYQTYDAIGRYSTTQQVVKKPDGTFTRATLPSIDTSSIIPESVGKDVAGAVANVQELAQRLNSVGPNKRVAFCAGKKLATFAMGTDPSVINSCSLRDVNERFYKSGSFLDFYRGLATSSGFATRNPG